MADRVLVTGACGMLGSHVVDRLAAAGVEVVALDVADPLPGHGSRAPGVRPVRADLTRPEQWRAEMAGCTAVVHAAALLTSATGVRPRDGVLVNVVATHDLLAAAVAAGVGRFVLVSSGSVYGTATGPAPLTEDHPLRGTSFYAVSKISAELQCTAFTAAHGLACTVLRMGSLYGPGLQRRGAIAPHLLGALDAVDAGRRPTLPGAPDATRDLVFVEDAAECVTRALTAEPAVLNVGTGVAVRNADLVRALLAQYGSTTEPVWEPGPGSPSRRYDPTRARAVLGYAPSTPLPDGLRALLAWRAALRSELR